MTRKSPLLKRTNVEIDEAKLKAAKKAFDLETTKDVIDFALTELLKTHDRKNILKLKGKIKIDLDLDESRMLG
jgi:Arc/MetJ family transcription regulator